MPGAATFEQPLVRKSSMWVDPHTPQALDIVKRRSRVRVTAGASGTTRATITFSCSRGVNSLSLQVVMPIKSSLVRNKPSVQRNPAPNSMSAPGVRMVMANCCKPAPPSIRISSGSSPTT